MTATRRSPRRASATAALFAIIGLVAGCGSDKTAAPTTSGTAPTTTAPATTTPPGTAPATTAPATTAPTTTGPATTAPATTLVPPQAYAGSTDATEEIRFLLGTPGPVVKLPDELTAAISVRLIETANECDVNPTTTTNTVRGEPAIGTIELRTGCDDSIGGARYTITMEGDDVSGWGVSSATRENLCLRGVSASDPLLCV